jgi:probable phosphoglycerate mutase
MTILYLIRHGETVDNVAQIMQGQTQGCLTEHGREQAEEVAARLAKVKIDAIVSSDLRRAIQTAEIISSRHGLPVSVTPLLRERDWGSFTGRYIPDLKDEVWPEDIESLDCLLERAQRFLEYIMTNYEGQTVVAVGHGIVNKAIQAVFYHKPMNQVQRMSNAEVRVLCLSTTAEVSTTAVTSMASTTVTSTTEAASSVTAGSMTATAKTSTGSMATAADTATAE